VAPLDAETRPLTIAVVPDSFKGSATATEVADAIAAGLRTALAPTFPDVDIRTSPMADGGEGTLDAFVGAWGVDTIEVPATDAIGRPVTARLAISPDGTTAIVEAAQANGLPLVSDVPLKPLDASSRGVGTLLAAALDTGADTIVLTIGGSATTDGGAGLLAALGARFTSDDGADLPEGGGALGALARVDVGGLHPRAREVTWRIACDVTNPLTGPSGAAAVFGPQKGALPDDVARLDAALGRLAEVLRETTGRDVAAIEGMGAAGGIPAVLHGLLGAELVAGSDLVVETLGIDALLAEADVVVTGEGRFDDQSFDGKVVDAVRRYTRDGVPVVVVAGGVLADQARAVERGITAALSIASGPSSLADLQAGALAAIERTAADAGRLIAAGYGLAGRA
jgi:glycerate kinase